MNTYQKLTELLSTDLRFVSDTGQLLKNKIVEQAFMLDSSLISLLLSEDTVKNHFFTEVDGVLIFDKVKFQHFVNNKEFLPGSYTSFKNKIGLTTDQGEYLSDSNEVVLAWPYKDCVLEGGQDKEDAKRQEVFYNETLAPDEIDRLTAPKVMTGFKKYASDGESVPDQITDQDNFIIKGNNLLALHTLKKQYSGKVKLIYIDPPYNTGSDSFSYNDNFNHSTWLTFMKNRLEIAKELLTQDGVIFIQCDDNEQGYLKVLLDDVFEPNNFVNIVTVKTKLGGVSGSSEGKSLRDSTEFIYAYCKNKGSMLFNPVHIRTPLYDYIENYINEGKSWKYTSIVTDLSGKELIKKDGGTSFYKYKQFKSCSIKQFAKDNNLSEEDVYNLHADKIFRTTNAQSSVRQTVIKNTKDITDPVVSIEYYPTKGKNKGVKTEVLYKDGPRNMFMFLSDMVDIQNGKSFYKDGLSTLWDDIQYNNLAREGGISFTNGKKPEKLIARIIELATKEGDLVLDYHLGSGTTAAVAHKMKRRYIGIEQLDYGKNDSVVRLNNVINGDDTGISSFNDVHWQGGGSFIYCELQKSNQAFIDLIQGAETAGVLMEIWSDMKAHAFLSYQVNPKLIDEHANDFSDLSLDDQKRFLIEVLDKNMLYVPYSEIDDETYAISNQDKALNKQFFGGK